MGGLVRFRDNEKWPVSELANFAPSDVRRVDVFESYLLHLIRGGAIQLSYASATIFASRVSLIQCLIGSSVCSLNVDTMDCAPSSEFLPPGNCFLSKQTCFYQGRKLRLPDHFSARNLCLTAHTWMLQWPRKLRLPDHGMYGRN